MERVRRVWKRVVEDAGVGLGTPGPAMSAIRTGAMGPGLRRDDG